VAPTAGPPLAARRSPPPELCRGVKPPGRATALIIVNPRRLEARERPVAPTPTVAAGEWIPELDAALDGSAVRTSVGDVSGWADRRCSLHPATIRGDVSGWPRAGGREPPAADVLPRGHPEVLPPARGPDPRPTGHVVPAGGTRPVHSQLSSPCGSRSGSLTEGAADLQSLDTGHGHARLGARTDGGVVSGHLPAGRSFPDHLGPPTPTLAWAGPPPTLTATPGGATVFPGGDTDIVDAHSSVWTVEAPTPCLRQPRNLFHVKHSGALTGNRRRPPGSGRTAIRRLGASPVHRPDAGTGRRVGPSSGGAGSRTSPSGA